MRVLSALLLSVACSLTHADVGDVIRSFQNENDGKVVLTAPMDWKPIERHHIRFGTTFYKLQPPQKGLFDLEILVNDLSHMKMDALVDRDLEIYIESNMASAAPKSVEGKAKAIRFGAKRDGVYARLTDKEPKSGEFVLFTQGVRLEGQKVVLFTLYSNDADGSILKKALATIESVKFEP